MPRYSYQGQLGHPLQGRVMQPDMRPLGTIRHDDASALSSPVLWHQLSQNMLMG